MVLQPQPPISPYGTLSGQLFLYAGCRAAFESVILTPSTREPAVLSPNKCILLGGLSDGLLPVPYTQQLENICFKTQTKLVDGDADCDVASSWSLVQPLLSSSYLGFGNGSLLRDTQELDELFSYLTHHRQATRQFCLIGHSTGCQNIVHYLQHGNPEFVQRISLCVLQAPVSDREHAMMEREAYETNLELAKSLKSSDSGGDAMMPRSAFWAPITADRYLDLHERGGADDFFSSDFSDNELQERLQHVGTCTPMANKDGRHTKRKALVVFSGSDEYVPEHIDSKLLTDRLVAAMNTNCEDDPVALPLFLQKSNHNLSSSEEERDTFVRKVQSLLVESNS